MDRLVFKDLFREAVKRSIISKELCERFFEYRDNRKNTAHDYGVNFAEETIVLLPTFVKDAAELAEIINQYLNASKE